MTPSNICRWIQRWFRAKVGHVLFPLFFFLWQPRKVERRFWRLHKSLSLFVYVFGQRAIFWQFIHVRLYVRPVVAWVMMWGMTAKVGINDIYVLRWVSLIRNYLNRSQKRLMQRKNCMLLLTPCMGRKIGYAIFLGHFKKETLTRSATKAGCEFNA